MGDGLELWWYGGSGYDRRQNERLGELEASFESRNRRLTSQLSALQGSIETRLNRLAQAFDAFVELSDLRVELTVFTPAAAARYHVRGLLASLSRMRHDPQARPVPLTIEDDVAGYWLVPAARVLASELGGEGGDASAHDTARRRDERRTGLFLGLALTLAGRTQAAATWLDPLLAQLPNGSITLAERALWIAAAEGRLGETIGAHLGRRLRQIVAEAGADSTSTHLATWRESVASLPSVASWKVAPAVHRDELVAPLRAAAELTALRHWCDTHLTAPPSGAVGQAVSDDATDPVAQVLRSLIDEGAAEEARLLRRANELRRVIESGTNENGDRDGARHRHDEPEVPEAGPTWDTAVGETLGLLRADGLDPARESRFCRALALDVGGPWLVSIAGELAATATATTATTIDVSTAAGTVRVTPEGPDADSLTEAEAAVTPRAASDPRARKTAAWVGGAGVAVCVVALVGVWQLVLVGLAMVAASLALVWHAAADARWAKEQAADDIATLRRRANEAARHLTAVVDQLQAARRSAIGDHAAIVARLGHDEPEVGITPSQA